MLFLSKMVRRTLSEAGVNYAPASLFGFEWDLIAEDFFVPLLQEYRPWFPNEKRFQFFSNGYSVAIPEDFVKPLGLYYRTYPSISTAIFQADKKVPNENWSVENGFIFVEGGGRFELRYSYDLIPQYILTDYIAGTNRNRRSVMTAKIPSAMVSSEDLVLKLNGEDLPVATASDTDGSFTVLHTYDLTDPSLTQEFLTALGLTAGSVPAGSQLKVACTFVEDEEEAIDSFQLAFTDEADQPLKVSGSIAMSYETAIPYVNLDWSDKFFRVFSTKFLLAAATVKDLMVLENLPLDVSADDLLSFARQKEEEFKEFIETQAQWWKW